MDIDTEGPTNRNEIRNQLSEMSFEELQKLKAKLGTKIYNETMFKKTNKNCLINNKNDFKRANKNRPRELSSKRPIRGSIIEVNSGKKPIPRDPRFDPLCGTFNEEVFKKSYKFVNKIKLDERQALRDELRNTDDPKRQIKINYLLQRLDNQIRQKDKKEKEDAFIHQEKQELKETLKRGEKPVYQKKSEKKIMKLLNQYKELKQSQKLKKHIEKKSKKIARKDIKKNVQSFD